MSPTYKVLKTDADLFAAALLQAKIYVVQMLNGKPHVIADYAGPVQRWTSDDVTIGGMTYEREGYEFRVRIPKPNLGEL